MHRQCSTSTSGLKRKRRSDSIENQENEPQIVEKKLREDNWAASDLDNHVTSTTEERVPFTELSVLSLLSCESRHEDSPTKRLQCYNEVDHSDEDSENDFFMTEPDDSPGPSNKYLCRSELRGRQSFGWQDYPDFWASYCDDSTISNERVSSPFVNHPNLQPRMRSVLLEWIIEVCDVYKLQRETYYLAVDYLDRFLSLTKDIEKTQLQLIGVTCLLVAAKYEEILPPKVSEFAYITDGACTEKEIINMELAFIKVIDWGCKIISANGWLSLILQLVYHQNKKQLKDIMIQQYSVPTYNKVAQLLDLVSMDEGFLSHSYKTIAVSAVYLAYCKSAALSVSGLDLESIMPCVYWMEPFWEVLQEKIATDNSEENQEEQHKSLNKEYSHTVLQHTVSLQLLEAGQGKLLAKTLADKHDEVGFLTPPLSSKKN